MRQIVLDTETTGLSAIDGDRIIEIGCVELLNRKLTGNNRHFYLHPEHREIHEEALRVHGITMEFLADKPKFPAIADDLLDYLAGAQLLIHNAPIAIGFLNEELRRLGRGKVTDLVGGVIDTLAMAKELYPGKRNGLDALCDRLEVDNSGRTFHGALLDAELLADVYINMTRGQNALSMEVESGEAGADGQIVAVDLSLFELPVLGCSESELEAHQALLADLDKASKGKTVWRKLEPAPEAA